MREKIISRISYIRLIRPIRQLFRRFTATRRRKALLVILVLLVILTSIRFVFFNPKEAKAAVVELTTTETTVQIDVAGRYRAILQKGDTGNDYLLFYDRAENNNSPDEVLHFVGPRLSEENTKYLLLYDNQRITTILESNSLRIRVRVEGCLDTATGGQCLQDDDNDGSDDVVKVTEEYTFTPDGMTVATMFDFQDNGVTLDTVDYSDYLYTYDVTLNSGTETDVFSETVIYGDGVTEGSRGAAEGDGGLGSTVDVYVVGQGSGGYQDVIFGEMEENGDKILSNSANGYIRYDIDSGGSEQDTVQFADVNTQTLIGHGNSEFFLRLKPQADLDSEDKREALYNDLTNPDALTYTTGEIWDDKPLVPSSNRPIFHTGFEGADSNLCDGGDGWDDGNCAGSDTIVGNEATTVYDGSYATKVTLVSDSSNQIAEVQKNLSSSKNILYARFMFNLDSESLANNEGFSLFYFQETTAWKMALVLLRQDGSGNLELGAGSSDAGDYYAGSDGYIQTDTWYALEFRAYRHATSGSVDLWLNGKNILSQTGIDTNDYDFTRFFLGLMFHTGANQIFYDNLIVSESYIGTDIYNEAEGYYTVDAESSQVQVDIDGSTYTRHDPAYKIRNYRENSLPGAVSLEGTNLVEGTDYNADYKPFSSAYFADELLWSSGLEGLTADIGSTPSQGGFENCTFMAGKYGGGVWCDDLNQFLQFAMTDNVNSTTGTIEFWYKNAGTPSNYGRFFGNSTADFALQRHASDTAIRFIINSQSTNWTDTTVNVFDGEWHHIRVTYSVDVGGTGDSLYLYLDGINQGQKTTNLTAGINLAGNMLIGAMNNTGANGIYDEFKIYNTVLGPDTIAMGGDKAEDDEYLYDESSNYTLGFEAADASGRGEYAFFGSDSMFDGLNVDLATLGTTAGTLNLDWEYWNGTDWANLESISGFTDGTNNLTQSGAIYWGANPTNWRPYSVNGSTDLYYVRVSMNNSSAAYSQSPIENLIRTDIILFQYYDNIESSGVTLSWPGEETAYWKFDEGYGSTAHDSGIATNNGTIIEATWQEESLCVSGKCLYYDGDGDYVSVTDNLSLDFEDDEYFTLEAWIRHGVQTSGQDVILAKYESSGGDGGYKLLMESDGDITFGIDDDNDAFPEDYVTSTAASYDDNQWHHIVGVKDASSIKLYIDAQLVGSDDDLSADGDLSNNDDFYIGIDGDGASNDFQGFIDEVKIFRYARTINQIKSDYLGSTIDLSAKFGGGDLDWLSDGLVGYWRMDETSAGSGQVDRSDSSGNGYTLTDNGTTASAGGKFGNGSEHVPGNSEYLSSATTINGVKSVSFWVNPDSTTNYYLSLTTGAYVTSSSGTLSAAGFDNPKIYINGAKSTTISADIWQLVTVTSDTAVNANQFYVGKQGDNYFDGTMDEIRLYNRALSPTEVRQLYNWAPGPVAYHPLDEGTGTTSTYDKSGNNYTGTLASITENAWVAGKFGFALDLDGSSGFIDVGTGPSIVNTVSFWVNPDSTSEYFIDLNGSAYVSASSGTLSATGFSDPTYYINGIATSSPTISADTWTHVAVTSAVSLNASDYNIGRLEETDYLDGTIDDVKLYNYIRTPAQIVEDMNAGHPAPGSPIDSALGHWKFDEGYGTTANNSGSGGSALNGTASGAFWFNDGRFGKSLGFDGYDDHVSVPLVSTKRSDMALSLWLYWVGNNDRDQIIFQNGDPGSGSGWHVEIDNSDNNELRITCESVDSATTNLQLTPYTWQHLLIQRNTSYWEIYLDGKTIDLGGSIYCLPNNPTNYTVIGKSPSGNNSFYGGIDEVKYYEFALTPDQVKVEYNQGSASVWGAKSTDALGNASWSGEREYCPPGDTTTNCAPVAHWKFDEGTGTGNDSVFDSSGNNHTGDMNNMEEADWVSGVYGRALNFDGNDDFIDIDDDPDFNPSAITFMAWFKLDTLPSVRSERANIIFKRHSESPWNSFMAYVDESDNNEIKVVIRNESGTEATAQSGVSAEVGKWYHVAGVADGTDVIVYINGIRTNSSSLSLTSVYDSDGYLGIGASYDGGTRTDGKIDDVRIYDYARTPAQIAWDYNQGKPVGWWRMDECSESIAHDASGNENNGTITIGGGGSQDGLGTCTVGNEKDAWYNGTNGKFNSSLNFDGSDDYITITDAPEIKQSIIQTYSMWIKRSTGVDNSYSFMYGKGSNTNSFHIGLVRSDHATNSDKLRFLWGLATNYSNGRISDTKWHHVVVIRGNGSFDVYIDGILDSSQTDYAPADNVDDMYIGATNPTVGSHTFDGQIDDFRIYNYPLTHQQVKSVFNEGALRFGQ